LDPEDVKSPSWGRSETSVKEHGSQDLASDYGTHRAGLKA